MTGSSPARPDAGAAERLRLAEVHRLRLLDTPPEERFDRITRTARRVARAPIALITLVDEARQWAKSCQGLPLREVGRSASFCAHAVSAREPLAVPDLRADPRFAANPLVTGPPVLRAYLGVPLHGAAGHPVGTLCVLDYRPRDFTADDVDAVGDLASWAESELNQAHLVEALARQRESEERLQTVLQAIPEGVATFDRQGRILSVNPAGERMYGHTAQEVVGRDVGVLLAGGAEAREALFRQVAAIRPGDEALRMELTGRRADGAELPLEISVGCITVAGGRGYVVAARDLTERRKAEHAVETMRRRQELILEAAAEGICWVDDGGLLVFANPSARRMFGLGDEDVAGIDLHARFHSFHPDGTPYRWEDCPTYRTLQRGEPVRVGSEVFFRTDGSQFAVDYASAPVVEHGSVTGVVLTFTDVTERREIERMKDEFVSVVSHELRTPLTSIRGSLGLLASGALGPLSAEAQRMADIAVSNTDRLVRLINDILDLERIESGRVQLQRAWVPVARLLEEAAASVAGMAEDSGVAITVRSVEDPVWVDADRIVQALANLLSNAVKFSPPGQSVELAADLRADRLELRVADRGRGIPHELQDRIFDRFQQVDASDARERGGTGLGLAIVRSIAEQHGGEVSVQSTPGQGSAFTMVLPAYRPGPAGDPRSPEPDRPVVLVVEDDDDLAEVLGASLARRGIDVVRAEGQHRAVAEAARLAPDLIVLDVVLGDGDGYGVVEHLRRDRLLAATPVLVYTVDDLDAHQRRRLVLGPTEFLTKTGAQVKDVEEKVLGRLGRGHRPDAGRRVLVIDDDPEIQEVAALALDRLGGYSVVVAGSGEEGVRLAREHRPDVILLDVMMPGLDGPSTLVRLRQDAVTAAIPVVFLTAKMQTAERDRLARMHVAGILPKPFDPLALGSELDRLMGWG